MSGLLTDEALRAKLSPTRGRPPLTLEEALDQARELHAVDFSEARARAGFARGHLLDVVLELPGGRGSEAETRAGEWLVEALLGEARAADWVGDITLTAAPRKGPLRLVQPRPNAEHFFALGELAPAIKAAIHGLHAGFSPEPLWATGGEQRYVLFELDVEPADYYPGQADVLLVSTFMPEMLKCFLSGAAFASTRFFRTRELLAYLKYENHERDPRRALAKRRVLEDAVDAALVSERSGRVVGSGMGVLHSYVNFALDDVERGVRVVREVGRRVGAGRQSAIEFCDEPLRSVTITLE